MRTSEGSDEQRFRSVGSVARLGLSLATACLAVATACGGGGRAVENSPAPGDGGSGGSGGGSAGHGGVGGTTGGAGATGGTAGGGSGGSSGSNTGACPSTAPAVGAACDPQALVCTFGASPFPECRDQRVCFAGKWSDGVAPGTCRETPVSVCPPSVPSGNPACESEELGARCAYDPGTLCTCVSELCGGTGCTQLPSPQWYCQSVSAGCPPLAPNAGTVCDGTHPTCEYEYCGLTARCVDGAWIWLFGCA